MPSALIWSLYGYKVRSDYRNQFTPAVVDIPLLNQFWGIGEDGMVGRQILSYTGLLVLPHVQAFSHSHTIVWATLVSRTVTIFCKSPIGLLNNWITLGPSQGILNDPTLYFYWVFKTLTICLWDMGLLITHDGLLLYVPNAKGHLAYGIVMATYAPQDYMRAAVNLTSMYRVFGSLMELMGPWVVGGLWPHRLLDGLWLLPICGIDGSQGPYDFMEYLLYGYMGPLSYPGIGTNMDLDGNQLSSYNEMGTLMGRQLTIPDGRGDLVFMVGLCGHFMKSEYSRVPLIGGSGWGPIGMVPVQVMGGGKVTYRCGWGSLAIQIEVLPGGGAYGFLTSKDNSYLIHRGLNQVCTVDPKYHPTSVVGRSLYGDWSWLKLVLKLVWVWFVTPPRGWGPEATPPLPPVHPPKGKTCEGGKEAPKYPPPL
ncbi:hypothetical protein G9A89_000545 [Geosiphon pyriformis]|nr:hypothetical protein G9A89_000545 [Geosiphon pyriformis]